MRLTAAADKNVRKQIEDLAEVLGSSLEQEDRVYRVQPRSGARDEQRRAWLLSAGFDVAKAEAALNSGAPLTLSLPGDEVPLPLPESFWRRLAVPPERMGGTIVTTIIGDRKAALLYYGMCAVDEGTRQFIAGNAELAADLYTRLAGRLRALRPELPRGWRARRAARRTRGRPSVGGGGR